MRDLGVSSVLGAIMMMGLLATLIPGAVLLRAAISDEMRTQRELAEQAAWCARHPTVGLPDCPANDPMPGYDCTEVELDTWLCTMTPVTPTPAVVTPQTPATPTMPVTPTVPNVPNV